MRPNVSSHVKMLKRQKELYSKKIGHVSKESSHLTKSTRHLIKLVLASMLFCLVSFSQTKMSPYLLNQQVTKALTVEFPFAPVYSWYQSRFGEVIYVMSPFTHTNKNNLALSVAQINQLSEGVVVSTTSKEIYALRAGVVTYVGRGEKGYESVRVQHESGEELVYQHLTKTTVLPYQYIQANEQIGEVAIVGDSGELALHVVERP